MNKKVQILMSTYNGERFIRKQLESIVAQDMPVSLLIRDDGSTDSTIDIIKEYQCKYDFISLVEAENVGVIKSFFELFRMADKEADYYSLADQDDIWFDNKISRAVSILESMKSDIPVLYCSKQVLADADDNVLEVKMKEVRMRPGFGNAIVENIATGCTCVFNKKMLEMAASHEPEYTIMHDWWLYLIASAYGDIYFDYEPSMYYRQHGNNTMGSRTNYIEEFKERVGRFSSNKGKQYRQMEAFNKAFELSAEKSELLQMVLGYKRSLKCRLKCIFTNKVYRQRVSDNVIFKLLFLMNHI